MKDVEIRIDPPIPKGSCTLSTRAMVSAKQVMAQKQRKLSCTIPVCTSVHTTTMS